MRTIAALIVLLASFVPSSPVDSRVPARDRAITFTVDGTVAYGTVHIPVHRRGQRLPAALLLPGSGPTDRDGDQPPGYTPHTLALLAGVLGAQGVLTVRFDKYGSGQTGLGAYTGHPQDLDYPAQVRQAAAAYAAMHQLPESDPHRLLILGHSEGGLTTLMLARTVAPHPAGLGLMEPQDIRLLDLIRLQLDEQLAAAVAAGVYTQAVADANRVAIDRVIAEFRAGQPIDTTGLLPQLVEFFAQDLFGPATARFVRSDDAVYPPDVARDIPGRPRVLLTCGTADVNVPCGTTSHLAQALHTPPTILPNVDHTLHVAGSPVNGQVLAPDAVAAVESFARHFTR
jgi:pimeloyl-ACP methyl ester carboxylesterase